jgi:hypothetical protein
VHSARLPASERLWLLTGLNLLRLLSQNRIAEFHTELELLPPSSLDTPTVRHAVHVEQWLMEGAYNQARPLCAHAAAQSTHTHRDRHISAILFPLCLCVCVRVCVCACVCVCVCVCVSESDCGGGLRLAGHQEPREPAGARVRCLYGHTDHHCAVRRQ